MENNKPAEGQENKGTPLVPDQVSEWGDLTQFQEPTVTTEEDSLNTPNSKEEDPNPDPANPGDDTPPADDYEEPEPLPQLEDPGPYVPKDYSFDVTVYDEEGKNGKTVKITSIEQFDELLDKDTNFGSPSELLKANKKATLMQTKLDNDESEWQKRHDDYQTKKGAYDAEQDHITNIAKEIGYMVSKGMLPAVDKKYESMDWRDPEVAKQPGVKEQSELLDYMRKENSVRQRAGLRPFASALDAYNAMQLDTRRKQDIEAKKVAGEARKAAGARIAGTTPSPVSNNVPKGIAVGRGGSLRDLNSGWGL